MTTTRKLDVYRTPGKPVFDERGNFLGFSIDDRIFPERSGKFYLPSGRIMCRCDENVQRGDTVIWLKEIDGLGGNLDFTPGLTRVVLPNTVWVDSACKGAIVEVIVRVIAG